MKKALTLLSVTAIAAVTLMAYLKTNEDRTNLSTLEADPNFFSNTSNSSADQPPSGRTVARLESLYQDQSNQIEALHKQIALLSTQMDELTTQAQLKAGTQTPRGRPMPVATRPSVADRFENNTGYQTNTTTNTVDVQDVVYANLPTNADAPITDCNGSVCKVYTFGSDTQQTNSDFVKNLSKNLSSNVNVYFVDEQGQQVIYVESVEE